MKRMKRGTYPEIHPYTYSDICEIYGISRWKLKKLLAPVMHEIGEKRGGCLYPKQVRIIFRILGEPGKMRAVTNTRPRKGSERNGKRMEQHEIFSEIALPIFRLQHLMRQNER